MSGSIFWFANFFRPRYPSVCDYCFWSITSCISTGCVYLVQTCLQYLHHKGCPAFFHPDNNSTFAFWPPKPLHPNSYFMRLSLYTHYSRFMQAVSFVLMTFLRTTLIQTDSNSDRSMPGPLNPAFLVISYQPSGYCLEFPTCFPRRLLSTGMSAIVQFHP